MFKQPKSISFAVAAICCLTSTSWSATYYISTKGNNSTGDGSAGKPWATLSYACSRVTTSGNTIYIDTGSYADNNRCNLAAGVNIQGAGVSSVLITSAYTGTMGTGYIYRQTTPAKPIAAGNNEISGFTLDGSNKTLYAGIFIRGTDHLNIHHLKFQNIKSSALWIQGYYDWANSETTPPPAYGQNDIIHDIETNDVSSEADLGWGARLGAIQLGALENAQVYNLTINENYAGRGTGVKAVWGWLKGFKGYNWTINTNVANGDAFVFEMYNFLGESEVYNCTFNHALSLNGGPQALVSGSSWNLKIHDTKTDFSGFANGALGHELSHNYLDFYDNYVVNNRGRGVGLWTTNALTGTSVTGWRFRNNVVYKCGVGGVSIEKAGTMSGVEIYNNVFDTLSNVPYGGYGISAESFSGTLTGAKIQNNLIVGAVTASIYIKSMTNTLVDHNFFYGNGNNNDVKNSGTGTVNTNNIKSNAAPGITGTGNRPYPYYQPSGSGSNLVNAGVNVGLPFSGSAPDIGAYEYQAGPAIHENFSNKNQNPDFIVAPNSFNLITSIAFTLHEATQARINIFNVNGECVKSLVDGKLDSGMHTVVWDGNASNGKTVSSGVYAVRMQTEKTIRNKMISFVR